MSNPAAQTPTQAEYPVDPTIRVHLPTSERGPLAGILVRIALAVFLLFFVAMVVYLDRDAYIDARDDEVTFMDALYYSTVSVTTTGYGDIVPATEQARLSTILFVTPARVLFLILLVGTTLEVLTERSRQAFRIQRWRKKLEDHVVVCGYGTKGQSVVKTLIGQGLSPKKIVAIDRNRLGLQDAEAAGLAAISGDSARSSVLLEAGVDKARAVIVAVDRDDTAVLATLTAREMNPKATIVAAVREAHNAHLLRQSGADSVITSSEASGRLLGVAAFSPHLVAVLEDLLTVGSGIELHDRDPKPSEIGRSADVEPGHILVALVRGDSILKFGNPAFEKLQAGDRLVMLCARYD